MSLSNSKISNKEAAVYDRQIRLWGVDAQKRMSQARVLVVGLSGICGEICKNLVLSGVGNICMMDDDVVTPALLGSQFFVTEEHIGMNRAVASLPAVRELNPLVQVTAEAASISSKDATFFDNFDVVCMSRSKLSEKIRVNEICRSKGILFFSIDSYGMMALMFQDLTDAFDYSIKDPNNSAVKINKQAHYVSLKTTVDPAHWSKTRHLSYAWLALHLVDKYFDSEGRYPTDKSHFESFIANYKTANSNAFAVQPPAIPDDFLTRLCRGANAELSAVCAIVGGIAAQEIIKVISRNADPINNYFVYDGFDSFAGYSELIK